jgi:hypothetical protein
MAHISEIRHQGPLSSGGASIFRKMFNRKALVALIVMALIGGAAWLVSLTKSSEKNATFEVKVVPTEVHEHIKDYTFSAGDIAIFKAQVAMYGIKVAIQQFIENNGEAGFKEFVKQLDSAYIAQYDDLKHYL